jgi:hypothetical protein
MESVLSNITVGEFIAAATAESHLPRATINAYARAFRRIVADVAQIRAAKKRFVDRIRGNQQWIQKIDAVRLAEVTPGQDLRPGKRN